MKKFLSLILVLVLCLSLAAPGVSYAATVKLNKTKLALYTENTYTLKLTGVSGVIKWTSNKKSVATVSSKGKVTAVSTGIATITAIVKNKKYKCAITVKSNKKVDIVYGALIFDDTTIEDYAKNYKTNNPEYLDVKVYDNDHIVVTMYESDRLDNIKEFNKNFDTYLASIITDENFDGVFTDIKADKLFKNITIYTDKNKYENSFAGYTIILEIGLISDIIQAINLVDVNDRACNITIIDNFSGDVLYPEE